MIDTPEEQVARYAPPIVDIELDVLGINMQALVRPLDLAYVSELAETDETVWEPIEVRIWPDEWTKPDVHIRYHVVSGNHRTSAARNKGLRTIRAIVIEAPNELSYLDAAIRTNARHGRNFTNDDRKELALRYKQLNLSTAQIAERFSVNRSTVKNWLSGRDSNASKKKVQSHVEAERAAFVPIDPDLSPEWSLVPRVTADTRQLSRIGQVINDFLSETPIDEDKAICAAWSASLTKETRLSVADDMVNTVRWLSNMVVLLKRDGEGAQ